MKNSAKVEEIVREYFNSAVIIDDELNLYNNKSLNNQEQEEFTDELLGLNNDIETKYFQEISEASASLEIDDIELNDYDNDPFQTYQEFLKEGFVTVPWQYTNNQDIDKLKTVLNNAKLLIIDWDLEPSHVNQNKMGDVSIKLIHSLISSKKGLKCAVIYTKEDSPSVQKKLEREFDCKSIPSVINENEEIIFFQEKDRIKIKSLFGFILTKKISPKDIIKIISNVLVFYKSIPIHLMESANLLNKNLNNAITEFNSPFEKVFLTQMITSDLSNENISRFINNNLISSVLELEEEELKGEKVNFLFEMKRGELLHVLKKLDKEQIYNLKEILNINRSPSKTQLPIIMERDNFIKELKDILKVSSSFDQFKSSLFEILKGYVEKSIVKDDKKYFKLFNEMLLFILLLDNFINEGKDEFKKSFKEQSINFTKMLKYSRYKGKKIKTGSIIKNGETSEYLLCITPACDTFRPEKVDNKFKFVVGEEVQTPTEENLKNNNNNCYYMPFPLEDKLIYIKWNFYESSTVDLDKLSSSIPIMTLKKKYIQNIINRYIAYQSRMGVDEIFYKESNYINNFLNIL